MKVAFRAVAVSVMLSLAWAGPLAPLALGQQPSAPVEVAQAPVAPPPAQTPPPAPAPPGTNWQMFQEQMKAPPEKKGTDAYDVGAVAATALGLPFKAGLCALGAALGIATFAGTFAARPDASAAIVNEGCGGKAKWIVRGSDLRPKPSVSRAFDWETHRFEWER
jgi:hypothetical protein